MRSFKVIAWTDNPYKIPKFRFASFTEPEFNEAGHVFEPEFFFISTRSWITPLLPIARTRRAMMTPARTGSLAHRSLTMIQGDITLLSVGDRWTDHC